MRRPNITSEGLDQDLIVHPDSEVTSDVEELSGEEAANQVADSESERITMLEGLAKSISDKLAARIPMRASKEAEWRKAEGLYNAPLGSVYSEAPDNPFKDETKTAHRPHPNIVRIKCDTAISNSVSMQFAGGTEKNWDLYPPQNNSDPMVAEACRRMEKEIEAQLSADKYSMKARKAMTDRVILGTGALKGPVNTGKRRIKYVRAADGVWLPQVSDDRFPALEYVSPWRLYPDMSVNSFHDSPDMIEIHPMRAMELASYITHPGFDGQVIEEILNGSASSDPVNPSVYNTQTLQMVKTEMWDRNPYLHKDRFLVIEYHGPVTYDDLQKLGIEPTYESPTMEYFGEVWVCAGKVIRMEIENIEGHYETPYAVSTWKTDPTSPFGYGHPLLLADAQQVIAATYHMILDNAALTSGSQIAMYQKYIQPIDGDWTIRPNKVWLLTDPTQKIDDAIKFFTPQNNIGNIMPVLQLTRQFADEESATSGIASGLPSAELTDTATGQLMMRQASTALLDFLAEDWDDDVTEKIVRRWYAWNMQYNEKDDIKGDYLVDVKSSSEFKNKAMYIRDMERLSMEVAQNPLMQDIVNVDGLYAARLAAMKLPSSGIIRTPEEIKAARDQRQQAPNPDMIKLEIQKMEAETNRMREQVKARQIQFETHQQQQRELWEHEERMGSNAARMAEAEAQVIKARTEQEIEMIKLAQKDQQFRARLLVDENVAALSTQSRIFIESMKEQTKQRKVDLTAEELAVKRDTGSGI